MKMAIGAILVMQASLEMLAALTLPQAFSTLT